MTTMKVLSKNDHMRSLLIKQPYALTMAKHRLNVYEMRVMMRIVEALQADMIYDKSPYDIEKTNLGDTTVIIPTKFLLVQDENYNRIRAALKNLTKKDITIQVSDEKGLISEICTNIIMQSNYEFRSELVKIKISEDVLPQFLGLAKNYSKYLLQVAFNSSSPNIMKLYQFVSHWRDKKQVYIGVDSLREWLKLEHKYKNPAGIKTWILKPAMLELKKKADVWFDIAERVTQGRRMLGWKFNIYTKKELKKRVPQLADLEARDKAVKNLADKFRINENQEVRAQREYKEKLIYQYKLSSNQADKLLSKVSDPRKLNNILYGIQLRMVNQKINNIGGYVVKVLAEHFDVKL